MLGRDHKIAKILVYVLSAWAIFPCTVKALPAETATAGGCESYLADGMRVIQQPEFTLNPNEVNLLGELAALDLNEAAAAIEEQSAAQAPFASPEVRLEIEARPGGEMVLKAVGLTGFTGGKWLEVPLDPAQLKIPVLSRFTRRYLEVLAVMTATTGGKMDSWLARNPALQLAFARDWGRPGRITGFQRGGESGENAMPGLKRLELEAMPGLDSGYKTRDIVLESLLRELAAEKAEIEGEVSRLKQAASGAVFFEAGLTVEDAPDRLRTLDTDVKRLEQRIGHLAREIRLAESAKIQK
jgi:hypothetical protein